MEASQARENYLVSFVENFQGNANDGEENDHHVKLVPLVGQVSAKTEREYFERHFNHKNQRKEPIRVHQNVVDDLRLAPVLERHGENIEADD